MKMMIFLIFFSIFLSALGQAGQDYGCNSAMVNKLYGYMAGRAIVGIRVVRAQVGEKMLRTPLGRIGSRGKT